MGDTTFWARVRDLGEAATPLVSIDVEPRDDLSLPAGTLTITEAGREVLAGRADAVRLNGVDRWLGGVHLSAPVGGDVEWRYDPPSRRLVQCHPERSDRSNRS